MIPNCEYFVPMDREPYLNAEVARLRSVMERSGLTQKVIQVAVAVLKNMTEVVILSASALICAGLAAGNVWVILFGGVAAAFGGICWSLRNVELRAMKLEQAVGYLIKAGDEIDRSNFYRAVSEIEEAQKILPDCEVADTRVFLNQTLLHLRQNHKEQAVKAAKRLIELTKKEISEFSEMKNIRTELITYLEKQVMFGLAVRDRFEIIYNCLDKQLIKRKCEFRILFRHLENTNNLFHSGSYRQHG